MSTASPVNLLLHPVEVEFLVQDNGKGIWRRFLHADGQMFAEFKSHATLFGWPMLHITWGRNPETMQRVTARGIIAIGRFAVGGIAIGQVSMGLIAIGHVGIGCLIGLGQAATGVFALGQLAIGAILGVGQLTCGNVAIGQLAFGKYVLAQFGLGEHVWDMRGRDVIAAQFFHNLLMK